MYILTALEIFTQADDLQILVGSYGNNNKYVYLVFGATRNNLELIFNSEPVFDTRDAAVDDFMKTLGSVREEIIRALTGAPNILTELMDPQNLSIEEVRNVLMSQEYFDYIEQDLRTDSMAKTHEIMHRVHWNGA